MRIALRGYRVLHDESAVAYDPQPLEPRLEAFRKKRTLAGNFQMLFRYPEWLWPWRNRLWLQLASHKYLRLLTPLFLGLAFGSNAVLASHPFYAAGFAGQTAFYLCAAIGLAMPRRAPKILSLPASFVFLNIAILRAFIAFTTFKHGRLWISQQDSAAPTGLGGRG
jgi:hypothetical protein